ncbi:putative mitochondrial protein [Tanacetum coccineum]|uniref:Mitochondrial protein n=1 Tax=Tanacetum coccineum TaxID=301880 RepID=A0ABQ4WBR0_9ASTR
MPNGLPPQRDHEHSIILKEGTEPISVRPYRYPHAQKSEIERLVSEMLQAGVIQLTTVLDKFPILVIDELLDELHGAMVFSKLDLKSGYGKIAWALTQQLKKDNFHWNEEATNAFYALKLAMSSVPVLALPNFSKEFVVETDASGYWDWSSANAGGKTNRLLHLKYLLEQRLISEEYQKWLTKLLGYDFVVQYKAVNENKAADALSRRGDTPTCWVISVSRFVNWEDMLEDFVHDSELNLIKEGIISGKADEYTIKGDKLFYKNRLVLPRTSKWIPRIFDEFHGGFIGGHAGTNLKYSTAYHPQTDGQTEVVNRSIETYLRCFTSEKPKSWSKWLSWAEYWYNTSFHSSANTTPFKILYGRDPPPLIRYGSQPTPIFEVDRYMEERDQVLKELKEHLSKVQVNVKTKADCHRRDVQFEVGDKVFLKLRPHRQQSVVRRNNKKLSPRYYGPYEILERIGKVAYKLKLPSTATIHPVFHVSQLKKFIDSNMQKNGLPEEMEVMIQPEKVLAVRNRGTNDNSKELLIRWKNLPERDASWEPMSNIERQFPDFHLEDKVVLWEVGTDTNQVQDTRYEKSYGKTYQRRHKTKGGFEQLLNN